jgi:hypothetical protein
LAVIASRERREDCGKEEDGVGADIRAHAVSEEERGEAVLG